MSKCAVCSKLQLEGHRGNAIGCLRNNTFSGIKYMDDWAIFGYDLFNEPRCPASQMTAPCTQRITEWANIMYAFAKTHNTKQLVTPSSMSAVTKFGALRKLHVVFDCDCVIALLQFTFGEEGFFAESPAPTSTNWWQRVVNSW